ncbi:MAG TPA: HmuY family protein [Moheibacter sp.]|nr:HmuY family protein [Moheibacter sp.]
MKKITTLLLTAVLLSAFSCLKEDDSIIDIPPVQGKLMSPNIGGPAQAFQVWVDLSDDQQIQTERSRWDLGFYSGDQFRVILNYSTMMAAVAIPTTDIDAVNPFEYQNILTEMEPTAGLNPAYIDHVAGNYLQDGTVIREIKENDADNPVYLLKLGYEPFTGEIPPYGTMATGAKRGFKKIRILRNDENSYKILFADLNESTHQEIIVQKDNNYHFSFFSFKDLATHEIQPTKNEWDLCFTVFNNVVPILGTYTFSDFILTNTLSKVGVYEVIDEPNNIENRYNQFAASDVNMALFKTQDHRALGDEWRTTVSGTTSMPVVQTDRFFVIKDAENNFFKLRFISMLDEQNYRGYPLFEYKQL